MVARSLHIFQDTIPAFDSRDWGKYPVYSVNKPDEIWIGHLSDTILEFYQDVYLLNIM
jgi:hypothetical protein